jgi:hypothetical protein
MEAVLHEGIRVLSGLDGFIHAYVALEAFDRAVLFTVWSSANAAEAGHSTFLPGFFKRHLGPRLESPPLRSSGDIIVFA